MRIIVLSAPLKLAFHGEMQADRSEYAASALRRHFPGAVYGWTHILEGMLKVSIIIPAWNEEERIVDCLDNATRQTVMPHEVLVVDNRSTDHTAEIVERYIAEHPDLPVKLLHQDEEQGLIPTRNYGLNHATGDILGRVDADCMLKPDWVEVVRGIFTEDAEAMGATGPVTYYDMPAHKIALRGDDSVRRHTYRADGGQVLLFGSNMALRASAWKLIHDEVCLDKEDVMHEDIDISLHLLGRGLKTVYSGRMICGISARRMDTSFKSFRNYMRRFKNTFAAHPEHWRNHKSERTLYLMYPWLHAMFPIYRQYPIEGHQPGRAHLVPRTGQARAQGRRPACRPAGHREVRGGDADRHSRSRGDRREYRLRSGCHTAIRGFLNHGDHNRAVTTQRSLIRGDVNPRSHRPLLFAMAGTWWMEWHHGLA